MVIVLAQPKASKANHYQLVRPESVEPQPLNAATGTMDTVYLEPSYIEVKRYRIPLAVFRRIPATRFTFETTEEAEEFLARLYEETGSGEFLAPP